MMPPASLLELVVDEWSGPKYSGGLSMGEALILEIRKTERKDLPSEACEEGKEEDMKRKGDRNRVTR